MTPVAGGSRRGGRPSRLRGPCWSVRLALVLLLGGLGADAAAQSLLGDLGNGAAQSREEPILVDADELRYDRGRETVVAEGDVVITHGPTVLAADRVELDRKRGEASAEGSIVLDDPQGRVRAARAWLEIEDETGFLEDAHVYLPQSRFQMSGGRMEKGVGQSYRIWDGSLTTCHCEEGAPDWSITGDDVEVDVGGYGTVRDGTFRVKDVPVLYLPYGLFPVRRERQSGFLFPRFGISNNRGFQWTQPFYWAIDKTQDATITFDVETSARIGLLGEYRYMLAPDAAGILTASYFNEAIRGSSADEVVDPDTLADPTIPENRGSIIGYHQQPGPWGSRIYARPFLVSDNLFLREMNTLSYLPTVGAFSTVRRYTDSRAGIVKVWDWGLFKGEATWYQDLIQKQSRVPQPLPRITLNARQNLLGGRLRLGLNSELVEYWRSPLATGPRLDLAPEARVPYRVGPYGYGSIRLVLRETAYYLTSNDVPIVPFPLPSPSAPLETRPVPKLQSREIVQLSADFNSEVSRVYDAEIGDLTKAKHTIEPFLSYKWVPLVDQDDIPVYDAVDRINARNLVTYGIVTRLLGKFGGLAPPPTIAPLEAPPSDETDVVGSGAETAAALPAVSGLAAEQGGRIRELARAFVQQSYEISNPFVVSSGSDEKANLSAVDAGLRLTPLPFAAAQGRGIFSPTERKLLYAEAGVNLFDPRPVAGPDDLFLASLRPVSSASLFYQFNSGGTVENLNLAATYRATNNVAFAYLGRFDVLADRFLENWVGLRLISGCDCWVVDLAFVDRFNPDEVEFRVLFSLVGLGSFGQQPFGQRGGGGFGRVDAADPSLSGIY